MPRKGANVTLSSYDEIFTTEEGRTESQQEHVQMIPLSELHPFEGHPFRVVDDEEMQKTVESVKQYGVLTPAIARPDPDGGYEIISGHRRLRASELAGLDKLPVIVREMDDDEAIIYMVDSNLQREHILPSERAFAYKMKMDALRHQGKRVDLTSSQVETKLRSDEIIAKDSEESRAQIQRYIRLTNLIPPLLRMIDEERIAFTPAVELSYLSQEEQEMLFTEIGVTLATPSLSQACRLKKLSGEGKLDEDVIAEIMAEEKPNQKERVSVPLSALKGKVPDSYTDRQLQEYVIKAVDHYHRYLMHQREVR